MKSIKFIAVIVLAFVLVSCSNGAKEYKGVYKIGFDKNSINQEELQKDTTLNSLAFLLIMAGAKDSNDLPIPDYCIMEDSTFATIKDNDTTRNSCKYTFKDDTTIFLINNDGDTIVFHNGKDKRLSLGALNLSLTKVR